MTKYKFILRTFFTTLCGLAALSMLAGIIYYYTDYQGNNELNLYIDNATIAFMYVMFFFFVFVTTSLILVLIRMAHKAKINESDKEEL